ncbi:MAG: SAM-dependent chlorinase/fluorinase [Cyanobacteria bacterium P01_D01_bin.115]
MMAPLMTLLTDFGYQDGYVGVMKGVIAGICPAARLIDLTHSVPPQNLAAARFTLLNAYRYFPPDTVHLVVVDPGVGTARRAVALQIPQGYLVGPDNGVLSGVVDAVGAIAAVELTDPHYWQTAEPSTTFHGRDIFAPVAAHLAAGVSLEKLGTTISPASLTRIAIPQLDISDTQVIGHIQHVDHFGNLVTTIPAAVAQRQDWVLQVGQVEMPLGKTYGDVEIGYAIALIGSHGWVEIAINSSSAQARFRLAIGDAVYLLAPNAIAN